jgi:hypothetical protein
MQAGPIGLAATGIGMCGMNWPEHQSGTIPPQKLHRA